MNAGELLRLSIELGGDPMQIANGQFTNGQFTEGTRLWTEQEMAPPEG